MWYSLLQCRQQNLDELDRIFWDVSNPERCGRSMWIACVGCDASRRHRHPQWRACSVGIAV
jgi:hypothetical protein